MKHRSLWLAMASLTVASGSALAGAPVGSWYVAPQALYVDPDREYHADDATGASLAFGKVLNKNWDVDIGMVDSSHKMDVGGEKLKLQGAVLSLNRVLMRQERVSPYIGIGVDYLKAKGFRDASNVVQSKTNLGGQVHVGLLADLTSNGALQLSAQVGKRMDKFSDSLYDFFAGVGLRMNFGAAAPAAAPVVAKAAPAPAPAPAAPVAPPPPADSDHDGVLDSADQCPNTVAGAVVDAKGCELDGDKDGVVDRLDKCPTTPAGDKVDAVGCSYSMPLQVKFDTNKATIKPESYPELDAFVKFLNDVPSAKGELQGHTDSDGGDKFNLNLSQRRADAVKAYIVGKGVDAARITTKGYGETQPVADNATAEGKAANRRVVFVRAEG